jgi:hypothetical protein
MLQCRHFNRSEEFGLGREFVNAVVCTARFASDAFLEQSHLKMWCMNMAILQANFAT